MKKFLAVLLLLIALAVGLWFVPEGKWAQLDETRTSIRAAVTSDNGWFLGSRTRGRDKSASSKHADMKDGKMSGSEKRKKVAAADKKMMRDVVRIESPTGRYVDAGKPQKMAVATETETMTAAGANETMRDIVRIESPLGRYVDGSTAVVVEDAPVVMAELVRVGSPIGRYVNAPMMAEMVMELVRIGSPAGRYVDGATEVVMDEAPMEFAELVRVGSPSGRYVDAPAMAEMVMELVRIGSPAGRYVDEPAMAEMVTELVRIGSPAGRYVDEPKRKKAGRKKKHKAKRSFKRVGSPVGRYVDEPLMRSEAATGGGGGDVMRFGSPDGRYVDAPAVDAAAAEARVVKTARKTETGALAFPIQFEFGTSDFTSEGRAAADELLAYVKSSGFKSITLSGHTDSIGTKSDNLGLSKKRLDAVSSLLRAGGYQGEIELLPKGESEPFTGVDRTKYSRSKLREFDRRVELRASR